MQKSKSAITKVNKDKLQVENQQSKGDTSNKRKERTIMTSSVHDSNSLISPQNRTMKIPSLQNISLLKNESKAEYFKSSKSINKVHMNDNESEDESELAEF